MRRKGIPLVFELRRKYGVMQLSRKSFLKLMRRLPRGPLMKMSRTKCPMLRSVGAKKMTMICNKVSNLHCIEWKNNSHTFMKTRCNSSLTSTIIW
jgi:hypothetical protein